MDQATLESAFEVVRSRWPDAQPDCGVVLGSGWGDVADALNPTAELAYEEIPGLGGTSVAGHAGRLSLATVGSTEVIVFRGRRHWYEGEGWTPLAVPVYVMKRLGVSTALLTNAAGSLRQDFHPGDLMAITDHINMLGSSPLIGPHDDFWGARFPDQSNVYDSDLGSRLVSAAEETGTRVHFGVYLATTGPTYETPAEVRAFRTLGADAVGMSTVPEAILANACGLRVVALSCLTNFAAGISSEALSHDDVTEVAGRAGPQIASLVTKFLEDL